MGRSISDARPTTPCSPPDEQNVPTYPNPFKNNFSSPPHFSFGAFKNGFLLVICRGHPSIGEIVIKIERPALGRSILYILIGQLIEVAFIRFYTSLIFIPNLPFPRDTQLLLPFHRRPPWLQRDYTIKQNPGLRSEYFSMYQLNAIRHVGRVAT